MKCFSQKTIRKVIGFSLSLVTFFSSSFVFAENVRIYSDEEIEGSIAYSDVLSSTLFSNQGLIVSNPSSKSLGYTSQSSSALLSTDLFSLKNTPGKRLHLTVSVPSLTLATIATPIEIETFDEELIFAVDSGSSLVQTGAWSGAGLLRKTGGGQISLGNLSSFNGLIVVESGFAFATSSVSDLSAALDIYSGASFSVSVDQISSSFIANDGRLTLSTVQPDSVLSAKMIGSGSLIKDGSGTLKLNGDSRYTGGTTIQAGRLILTETSFQGDIINSSELECHLVQDALYEGALSGSGTFYKTGPGLLTLTSSLSGAGGAIFLEEGGLLLNDNSFVGNSFTLSSGTVLTIDRTTDFVSAGTISGSGTIIKRGSGDLSFSNALSYSALKIFEGDVSLTDAGLSGDIYHETPLSLYITNNKTYTGMLSGDNGFTKYGSGSLIFANGINERGVITIEEGSLQLRDGFGINDVSNNGTLIFNLAQSNHYSKTISGSGALIKRGGGDLTFVAQQTYTGGTSVEEGQLIVYSDAFYKNYDLTGTLTLVTDRQDRAYSDLISGSGNFNKRGLYDLYFNAVQTYTGVTDIQEGDIHYGIHNALSNQTEVHIYPLNTLYLHDYNAAIGGLSGSGSVSLGSGNLSVGSNNRSADFSGLIYGTGSVSKAGTGTWFVHTAQSYTGSTNVLSGILKQGINQMIPSTNLVFVDSSGVLDMNGYSLTLGGLTGSGEVKLTSADLTLHLAADNTFGGQLTGSGSLYKTDLRTLTLSSQSTFAGNTYIQSGSLVLSGSQALPYTTGLTISAGASVLSNASQQKIKNLYGSGTLAIGSSRWIFDHGDVNFSGTVTGNTGSYLDFLSTSAVFSGGLTNLLSSVSVDSSSSLTLFSLPSAVTSFVNNGALIINTTQQNLDSYFAISGTGSLTIQGSNDLSIRNHSTYTGLTTLSGTGTDLYLYNANLATSGLVNSNPQNTIYYQGSGLGDWNVLYPISGSGSVVFNVASSQTLSLKGNLSYTGHTTINTGTVKHDSIAVSLNGGTLNIAQNATYQSVNSTIALLGSYTLNNGLWHQSASTINTTGATASVSFLSPGNTVDQTGLWIDSGGLTINTSDQDLYLYTNVYGTGNFTKTGSHTLYMLPANQLNYSGTTTVSAGTLELNENYNSTSAISIGSGAFLDFKITNTSPSSSSNYNPPSPTDTPGKTIASSITGLGTLRLRQGEITLTGQTSYTGSTILSSGTELNITTGFQASGDMNLTDAVLNITVPEGQTLLMNNRFIGTGNLNKYGLGTLALRGSFGDLRGLVKIWDGYLQFSTAPPGSVEVEGDYIVVGSTGSVLSLSSDVTPIVFGGTITGVNNTRFRLIGYKDHADLTIRYFTLSGILDLMQLKSRGVDTVYNDVQFKLDSIISTPYGGMNFQFDQSDDSNQPRTFLKFETATLPESMTYSLQAVRQSGLFENRVYRLIELDNPTQEEIDKIVEIANKITAPAVFDVVPTVTLNDTTGVLTFDVSLTKYEAGTVVKRARRPVSLTVTELANQLQSLGQNDSEGAQNTTAVLEFCPTVTDMFDEINRLTPTGNKKKDQAVTPTQSAQHSQSTLSSFNLQSLAMHLNKQQSGRYKSPFASFGKKPFEANVSRLNRDYSKYIQKYHDKDHNFQWADLFDGMELAGLSVSVETNYVHQRVKSQDIEPDYLINAWGTTLGSSKVLEEKYIVGVLASYLGRKIEMAPNNQDKTAFTHERVRSIGVFTAYQDPDKPYYVSGFLSLGNHHYSSNRTWQHPVFNSDDVLIEYIPSYASNKHKGYDMTGNLEIGYTHIVNQSIALQPFVGAGFVHLYEPSYDEQSINSVTGEATLYGNHMFNSHISKQTRTIGMQGIQSVVTDDMAYQVSCRMSYVTEKINGDQSYFEYAYLYGQTSPIALVSKNERFGSFEMSLGLNAAYANQWIVSTNYVGQFGKAVVSHTVVATVQYTFS